MENLVKYLVCQLVDNKDSVVVSTREEEDATVIEVQVDSSEIGRVIGKKGRVASSIRTIVKSANPRTNKKVFVKFIEKGQD